MIKSESRRAAAVRRQMDYAARVKADAGIARQLAVRLGVKSTRGKSLDAAAMFAAIDATTDVSPDCLSGDATVVASPGKSVALLAGSASLKAEIVELKMKIAALALLNQQLGSDLRLAAKGLEEAQNKCVVLEKRVARRDETICRVQSDLDKALAAGDERGVRQTSNVVEEIANDYDKLRQKIDALDRRLSAILEGKSPAR